MPNIIETLQQTEMWYAQDGMPYRLVDMEPSHRFNVLGFLKRRAQNLVGHRNWQDLQSLFGAPDEVFDAWMHQIEEPADRWLARQPLVVELERLCRLDGSMEGEVVESKGELT